MISAFWLFPIIVAIAFASILIWEKYSLLEIERDYWRSMFGTAETYGRNLEHIAKGEPVESYEEEKQEEI